MQAGGGAEAMLGSRSKEEPAAARSEEAEQLRGEVVRWLVAGVRGGTGGSAFVAGGGGTASQRGDCVTCHRRRRQRSRRSSRISRLETEVLTRSSQPAMTARQLARGRSAFEHV